MKISDKFLKKEPEVHMDENKSVGFRQLCPNIVSAVNGFGAVIQLTWLMCCFSASQKLGY